MNLVWDQLQVPQGLLMFGGDFHITLKLLVFLPEAKAAAKSGGLKAGGCPKDGK